LLAGATHDTNASLDAGLATTPVGALGGPELVGVTAFDAADAVPDPAPFTAVTVNVYAVPAVNAETDPDVTDPDTVVVACAVDPTYGVITYEDGVLPDDGAVHDTVAPSTPAVAVTPVGCPGRTGWNSTSTQ
jgi:hypothetical protein